MNEARTDPVPVTIEAHGPGSGGELWDFLEHAAVALHSLGEDGTILWAE